MAYVAISQIKPGDRLLKDVHTKRNHLLMTKGTILTPRDIEILHAFLIAKVNIEGAASGDEQPAETAVEFVEQQHSPSLLALYEEYEKLFVLIKRIFVMANSGASIPILEIRSQLEALLRHIDEYNILFFKPLKYSPKEYMYHHSIRVALTSYVLARWAGLQKKDLLPIAMAGLLHDIGNVRVDADILNKTTALTEQEFAEVREHTLHGYALLKNVTGISEGVKLVAQQHHEREDGSGYPLGLKGDSIHLYTKIVTIGDIFHAMNTTRLYRNAISPYLVLEELLQYSFGKLDPKFVRTFIDKVTQFHNGTIVKLSDGRVGEIVFSQREHPTRPWVNVNGTIVNLTIERNLHIEDIIQNQ